MSASDFRHNRVQLEADGVTLVPSCSHVGGYFLNYPLCVAAVYPVDKPITLCGRGLHRDQWHKSSTVINELLLNCLGFTITTIKYML